MPMLDLVDKMFRGDSYALSRLITLVENDRLHVHLLMDRIHNHMGHAYFVGVTGPPGAGKSSLTSRLTETMRREGATVGIVACDPSSPFSGGAILGDRIRMNSHFLDDEVFIRSMATRGSLGGLSQKVHAVASLLDAFGKDFVLLETVGVGQTELDVRSVADTNVLVLTPMAGDHIQAMKSGIIETADIFVVNKMDLAEARVTAEDIADILNMRIKPGQWKPPIILTQAIEGIGIPETLNAVKKHRKFLRESGQGARNHKQRQRHIFTQVMKEVLLKKVKACLEKDERFVAYLIRVENKEISPYAACEVVLTDKKIWQNIVSHLCDNEDGTQPLDSKAPQFL